MVEQGLAPSVAVAVLAPGPAAEAVLAPAPSAVAVLAQERAVVAADLPCRVEEGWVLLQVAPVVD